MTGASSRTRKARAGEGAVQREYRCDACGLVLVTLSTARPWDGAGLPEGQETEAGYILAQLERHAAQAHVPSPAVEIIDEALDEWKAVEP